MRRRIEGTFRPGERVVVIDDIVTDGASKLEAIEPLEAAGLVVEDLVVLVDREQGGRERLAAKGYRLHAVVTISACFDALEAAQLVDHTVLDRARVFVRTTRVA
jgi:uridine monophosphate synthetase